ISRVLQLFLSVRHSSHVSEQWLSQPELQGSQQHEYSRQAEAPVPAYLFSKISAEHHSEEGSCIYSHIENGIGPVLLLGFAPIHFRNNGGDVRFKESCTNNQQSQA